MSVLIDRQVEKGTLVNHTSDLDSRHSSSPKGGLKAIIVCLTAALFFFYEFVQMHMFDAINDSLREAFHVSATSLSLLSSSYLWADLLFLLPAGILLDKYSVRKNLIIALLLCVIGTLGFGLATSFWSAAFFHFLAGIGNAFCFVACVMLVTRWFPERQQGTMIAVVITMAFLGGITAQAPLSALSHALGWRMALVADALLGVVILWLVYALVEDSPVAKTIKEEQANLSHELPIALSNRQNYFAGLYTSLLNLPIMVLCALWGMSYLAIVHQLTKSQATDVVSMIFVGSIIGSPLIGYWSDKIGERRRPMLLGGVLTLALSFLLPLSLHLNYVSLLLLFFALGLVSSTQVLAYPMVAESNSLKVTGTATAVASCIIMGGAAVAQVLFGKLLDWHWAGVIEHGQRVYSAMDYQFAMWLFPITIFIGIVAAYLCYDPLKHKPSPANEGMILGDEATS